MKRPTVIFALCYCLGIALGYIFDNKLFVFIIVISILLFYKSKTYYRKCLFILPLICFFGMVNIYYSNYQIDKLNNNIDFGVTSNIEGIVTNIEEFDDYSKINCKISTIKQDSNIIEINQKAIIYDRNKHTIKVGDLILISGELNKTSLPTNPGQFNERQYYNAKNIYYKVYANNISIIKSNKNSINYYLYILRENLSIKLDNIYPSNEANIIKTMVLGLKEDLPEDTKDYYKRAGISHLLAISGLHIAIIGLFIFGLLNKMLSMRISVFVTIFLLIIYCILTGSSISTVRATIMISIMLMGNIFYRKYDTLSALGATAIIILTFNPYQLFDAGFLLSFSAVIGIIVIGQNLNYRLNKNNNIIIATLLITLGATLGTYPVILWFFYELPMYSIIINLFVVNVMSIVIGGAIIGLIFSYIWLPIGKFISGIVFFVLRYIEICTKVVSKLPFNKIILGRPNVIWIIIYLFIIIIVLYPKGISKKKIYISSIILVAMIIMIGNNNTSITFLDVGQGDCSVIEHYNKVYIIDGGGKKTKSNKNVGSYILEPYLKYKGIRKIEGIFISHSDFDHIYGIIEIIDRYPVNFIIMSQSYEEYNDDLVYRLKEIASRKNIDIYYMKTGDKYTYKDLTINCDYPNSSYKEYRNNNLRSLVLTVSYNNFNILYTGDIEKEGERNLVENVDKVNIIKVPHHGANTSSTIELINKTHPQISIYSYGKNNTYGHPSNEVVNRYNSNNVNQYFTAKDGAIIISNIKNNNYTVETYFSKRKDKY